MASSIVPLQLQPQHVTMKENRVSKPSAGNSSPWGSIDQIRTARLYSFGGCRQRQLTAVAAVGEMSSDSTTYLIAGAAAVALLGTAFPILFSRKDTCPECDGAGFVRAGGGVLRANAARKDQAQIVCKRCNGLGKLNQIDKQ